MFTGPRFDRSFAAVLCLALCGVTGAVAQSDLKAPANFKATPKSQSEIELTWDKVEGATTYGLLKKTGEDFGLTYNVLADKVSMVDMNLLPGTMHCYKIRTVKGGETSSASDEACGTTLAEPSKSPKSVKAVEKSASEIEVSWDKYEGASFEVERTKGDATKPEKKVEREAGSTKWLDKGLEKQTKYSYQVRAITAAGATDLSSPAVSATTGPPKKPTLTGEAVSDSVIKLTWTPEADATQVLTRSKGKGAAGEEIKKDPGAKEHLDTGLDKNTDYFYKLKVSRGGEAASDEVKVTTQDVEFFFRPNPDKVVDTYDPAKVNNIVKCTATEGGKWCEPQAAIYVTGWEASTIELDGLPPTLTKIMVDGGGGNTGNGRNAGTGDLSCVIKTYQMEPRTRVLVNLYRERNFNAPYAGPTFKRKDVAFENLRGYEFSSDVTERCQTTQLERPAIEVSRKNSSAVAITIYWEEDPRNPKNPALCLPPKNGGAQLQCSKTLPRIDLVFQTWWIELGGFYAFFNLTDEEVVSQAVPADPAGDANQSPMVEVLRISSGDEQETATGVMSTFFPANYPWFGLSFGLTENSGRSLSYFLGPSVRLLGRRSRAVVTFTGGLSWIPVKRFPGVSREALGTAADAPLTLPAQSPLLNGEVEYQDDIFFAVTLGFALERRSTTGSNN